MDNIYILTGQLGCGKTTFVYNLLKEKMNAAGIITITENEKRYLLSLHSGEKHPLEVEGNYAGEVYLIGKYVFYVSSFDWAEEQIKAIDFSKIDYFVLDELGCLEENKFGFYNSLPEAVKKLENTNTKGIFVVRESSLSTICSFLGVPQNIAYTKDNFPQI